MKQIKMKQTKILAMGLAASMLLGAFSLQTPVFASQTDAGSSESEKVVCGEVTKVEDGKITIAEGTLKKRPEKLEKMKGEKPNKKDNSEFSDNSEFGSEKEKPERPSPLEKSGEENEYEVSESVVIERVYPEKPEGRPESSPKGRLDGRLNSRLKKKSDKDNTNRVTSNSSKSAEGESIQRREINISDVKEGDIVKLSLEDGIVTKISVMFSKPDGNRPPTPEEPPQEGDFPDGNPQSDDFTKEKSQKQKGPKAPFSKSTQAFAKGSHARM